MFVDLAGPAGRLEALLTEPSGAARYCAVVCHPHPQFGGTLHNHATYRLAKAVNATGGTALRFNFRGVGRSAGKHDEGRGEVEDARTALRWLDAERPALPKYCAGFSFGARTVMAMACPEAEVKGILAAGLPVKMLDFAVAKDCPKKVAVVQAEKDEFGSPAEIEALLAGSAHPRRLATVKAASHLFTEDLATLQREAEAALFWLTEGEG